MPSQRDRLEPRVICQWRWFPDHFYYADDRWPKVRAGSIHAWLKPGANEAIEIAALSARRGFRPTLGGQPPYLSPLTNHQSL